MRGAPQDKSGFRLHVVGEIPARYTDPDADVDS